MPDQIIKIVNKYDEALNKADSEKYKLSIQFSLDSFTFCIFDEKTNKFLSIESITIENPNRVDIFCSLIKQFFSAHSWLNLKFKSTNIIYETRKSTLIPSPLFDETEKDTYSDFNFTHEEDHCVYYDKLTSLDAFNLYAVPVQLKNTLSELFPDHNLLSHSGSLIECLLILYKNLPVQKRVFVNVRNSYLDIAITEGKKLLYFNSFTYKTKEDFIYYVIFVLEQLDLNPEEIELVFSGFIDKNTELFDIAYKYVRNIQFPKLTNTFRYSYIFNDIPSHYYFNLLNITLCEL